MTVHVTGEPAAAAPLRLRDPAELLVAIPVLLGFRPRDSLVVICLEGASGRRVGLTMRVDLPPPNELAVLGEQLVHTVASRGARQIVLAVICGAGRGDDHGGGPVADEPPLADGLPRRDVADQVLASFDAAGVVVSGRMWAAELVTGAAWSCYDECGCAGRLDDPSATPAAAASVAAGQVTFEDRSELARLVAPVDPAALARRSARLDAVIDAAVLDGSLAGDAGRRRDVTAVLAALADAALGRLVLGDDDVVRLAAALSDPRVRDTCLDLTLGADPAGHQPAAIEQLWAALTRETPDPEAAEPATLLAVAAFLRGNGGLANVALERAQRAWPGHRLSALIDAAITAGLSPDDLRSGLLSDDRDGE